MKGKIKFVQTTNTHHIYNADVAKNITNYAQDLMDKMIDVAQKEGIKIPIKRINQ